MAWSFPFRRRVPLDVRNRDILVVGTVMCVGVRRALPGKGRTGTRPTFTWSNGYARPVRPPICPILRTVSDNEGFNYN